MDAPVDIAFSPDSLFAYVTGYNSNSVAIFKQNDAVASKFSFVGSITATTMSTHTLSGPHGLVVSPDGKNLYVIATNSDVLAAYKRNTTTGLLTPIQTRYQGDCQDASFICLFGLSGLSSPYEIAISPDGRTIAIPVYDEKYQYIYVINENERIPRRVTSDAKVVVSTPK